MFFRNLTLFRFPTSLDFTDLETHLGPCALKPVGALELFSRLPEGADRWARHHHDIIRRFGRFPHRNAALGRESTTEERAFLAEGGFSG